MLGWGVKGCVYRLFCRNRHRFSLLKTLALFTCTQIIKGQLLPSAGQTSRTDRFIFASMYTVKLESLMRLILIWLKKCCTCKQSQCYVFWDLSVFSSINLLPKPWTITIGTFTPSQALALELLWAPNRMLLFLKSKCLPCLLLPPSQTVWNKIEHKSLSAITGWKTPIKLNFTFK